ncbi:hypothetical protein ET445_16340 [Agromyces protaetiae]|uniref:Uncharacterized protein n=1 Tax=Agromyces protaetiae TaxID=2509455 RepID=A0A4P6FVN4_9MICO|nr:hypothetical protein [Agromyces protaetiae]QAY74668.1 hypothetical protein ET445_16340 [Agromyces protaetiae]
MHPTRSRRRRAGLTWLIAFIVIGGLWAVGAAGLSGAVPASAEEPPEQLTIEVWSGGDQQITPGLQFAEPLMTRMQGADDWAGASVEFLVDGGNAVFVTETGQLSGVSVPIDVNGFATSPPLLAGDVTGAFEVSAQVASGGSTSNLVVFQLEIVPLAPTTAAAVSGEGQTTFVGEAFPLPLETLVADQLGDPVTGASVTFTIPPGPVTFVGGVLAAAATTGSDGTAVSPQLLAGDTAGSVLVTASVEGGSDPSTTFSLRVVSVLLSADEVGGGEPLHASSPGFAPQEQVVVRLDGAELTSTSADADGRVEVDLVVPAGTIPGPHLLELVGASSGTRSTTLLVRTTAPAATASGDEGARAGLPATGRDASISVPFALGALLVVGLGAAALTAARPQRAQAVRTRTRR